MIVLTPSAHGYGHATRCVALADELATRGGPVSLVTAAPASVLGDRHPLLPWHVDVGFVQHDSLTEDIPATLALLEERCSEAAIDALASRLAGASGVIVDISPPALEAARRAGVPAVAMGNFDWAWVYRHVPALSAWAERFARWQAPHPAIQLRPGPDLTGFASVVEGGLLARSAPPIRVAERGILVCFGGFGQPNLKSALPELPGVTWIFAPPLARPVRRDCLFVDEVPFSSLLAGADALFTKPGYGVLAEAMAAGTPILWLDRGSFPEAPYLEAAMRTRGDEKCSFEATAIARAGGAILTRPRPPGRRRDDRARIADLALSALRCPG